MLQLSRVLWRQASSYLMAAGRLSFVMLVVFWEKWFA
jgi:hypothetical protein